MKFGYDLDRITRALSYNDLKGLIKLIEPRIFSIDYVYTSEELENIFKDLFYQIKDKELLKQIESLMISCARVNSIGY